MSTIISMAVWDTEENDRSAFTEQTLDGICRTANWNIHDMVVVDNASCAKTQAVYERMEKMWWVYGGKLNIIRNSTNEGTAKAISRGWKTFRKPGQHCMKCDNDWRVDQPGWLDILETCLSKDPKMGIICLKRGALTQAPWHPKGHPDHTELVMLPHVREEPWYVIEKCQNSFGTVQLYRSELIDKIGALVQPSVYGWDDILADVRCRVAGFYSCFYPGIKLIYLDHTDGNYQRWKEKHAGEYMEEFQDMCADYMSGRRAIYEPFPD